MRILMTNFIKKSELNNDWYIIDGNNAVVGRLASIIAKIIRKTNNCTKKIDFIDNSKYLCAFL